MKKLLFLLFAILFLGFVYADCDGCFSNNICYDFGNVTTNSLTGVKYYCDYSTKSLIQVKAEGASCENDFECSSEYSCLGGKCTANVAGFLSAYNTVLAYTQNISLCIESNMFCYNSSLSAPLNSTALNNTCDIGLRCYSCNSGLNWNSTLSKCIKPICQTTPGCLNISSLTNASVSDNYCVVGSCFSCDSDFDWNSTNQTCQIKQCSSSPGCLNQTSLTNGRIVPNRFCSSGSCFACNTTEGYRWNSITNSCVYSTTIVINPSDWNTIQFSSYDLQQGTEKVLRAYDRLQFSFDGRPYYLALNSVDSSGARISYKIDPILNNLYAYTGAENNFDLNSDGKLDILVQLVSISSNSATVKLMAIQASPLPVVPTPTPSPQQIYASSSPSSADYSGLVVVAVAIVVFVILVVIILLVVKAKNAKKTPQQIYNPQTQPSPYYPQNPSGSQFRSS
jgi:hypothetical protein